MINFFLCWLDDNFSFDCIFNQLNFFTHSIFNTCLYSFGRGATDKMANKQKNSFAPVPKQGGTIDHTVDLHSVSRSDLQWTAHNLTQPPWHFTGAWRCIVDLRLYTHNTNCADLPSQPRCAMSSETDLWSTLSKTSTTFEASLTLIRLPTFHVPTES